MSWSSRLVIALVCATILAAGYAVSPKELPTLELVVPAGTSEGEVSGG